MTVFAKFHWNGFNKPNLIVFFFFICFFFVLLLFYLHKASVWSELVIKFSKKYFQHNWQYEEFYFLYPLRLEYTVVKIQGLIRGWVGVGAWCKGLVTLFLKSLGVRMWSSSVWIWNNASDLFPGALNKETFHSVIFCFIALFIPPSVITNDSQSASVFVSFGFKG